MSHFPFLDWLPRKSRLPDLSFYQKKTAFEEKYILIFYNSVIGNVYVKTSTGVRTRLADSVSESITVAPPVEPYSIIYRIPYYCTEKNPSEYSDVWENYDWQSFDNENYSQSSTITLNQNWLYLSLRGMSASFNVLSFLSSLRYFGVDYKSNFSLEVFSDSECKTHRFMFGYSYHIVFV